MRRPRADDPLATTGIRWLPDPCLPPYRNGQHDGVEVVPPGLAMTAVLTAAEFELLDAARTATLATVGPDGRPRLVPICFVVGDRSEGPVLSTPIDEKPKASTDPRDLARVRDIGARPAVSILVHRWSEDWTELAWLRLEGRATLVEPPIAGDLVAALVEKYPQYANHDLVGRPILRIAVLGATSWAAS